MTAHPLGRLSNRGSLWSAGTTTLLLFLWAANAFAVNTSWNVAGPANYTDGANWNTTNAPTGADNVFIANGGTAQITGAGATGQQININNGTLGQQAGTTFVTTQWVNVGLANGQTGTYNMAAGATLNQGGGNFSVGENGGTGIANLAGTVNIPGEFNVGAGNGATSGNGTVTLSGTATANIINVGKFNNSVGTVNVTGGTLKANNWINVGSEGSHPNAQGTFNISGSALVEAVGHRIAIGIIGKGTVNQSGGTLKVSTGVSSPDNDLIVGGGVGGTYNLTNGSVQIATGGDIFVAQGAGTGVFNQSGGAVTSGRRLTLATDAGSTGTYNLFGGTLTIPGTIVEGDGMGMLNVAGGTLHLLGGADRTAEVDALRASGIIKAYGGAGALRINFTGNSTVVTAVPEPGAWLLLASAICSWKRRRRT